MKKVGVIGSGVVGKVLASGFIRHGYEVMIGSRDLSKLTDWKEQNGDAAHIGSFAECAEFGEIIVLATKGNAAMSAIELAGISSLSGKTILDATNPIDESAAPQNGVLKFFTGGGPSLMEMLQEAAPEANFVKCFSCVGNALMVNPELSSKPSMFICGNNDSAKAEVSAILDQFGWETEDMSKANAALAIESLCILWCIPGFASNDWYHAFKMIRN